MTLDATAPQFNGDANDADDARAIEIPPLQIETVTLTIEGVSPLICHRFSEKARAMMLAAQQGKESSTVREPRDPWAEYCDAFYWLSKRPKKVAEAEIAAATFGFPALCLKKCAVNAITSIDKLTKVSGRQVLFVRGIIGHDGVTELIPIEGEPTMREDVVRIGRGSAEVRFRPQFWPWQMSFDVEYNAGAFTLEKVIQMFQVGGFGTGIGEWRPQKDGPYGRFVFAGETNNKG